jgi:hypothetical protein
VLDKYGDHLGDEEAAIRAYLYEPARREHTINSLQAGSVSRRILLAYYGIDEDTDWREARSQICNKQSYKDTNDFPQNWVADGVMGRLQPASEE